MIFAIEISTYLLALVLLLASNGGNIPTAIAEMNVAREVTMLTNMGQGYENLCSDTNFACKDVATAKTITSGAAPVEAGYVPVVLKPPIGASAAFDVVSTAKPSNSAEFSIAAYSTVQVDGGFLQNLEAYTVTANGTAPPTVADDGVPVAGTVYTLEYDPCMAGVIVTTATTPVVACP